MKTQRTRRPYGRPVTVLGMVALMILMAAGGVLASHQFSDVPDDHPFHDEIGWMADAEITGGFADGTFRPTNPVTRMAMAAFMMRLAGHDPDVDPMVLAQHALEADWAEIAEWAEEAGHAEVADWAAAADWADEAGDAEQLGGIDAEEYITDSGFNVTSSSGGDFLAQDPATNSSKWTFAGHARWDIPAGPTWFNQYPDVDVTRFGETQYLHRGTICLQPGSGVSVGRAEMQVHTPSGGVNAELLLSEVREEPDLDDNGCFGFFVDQDPDTSGSAQGFELREGDYVTLSVRMDSDDDDNTVRIHHSNLVTSAQEFRTTLIFIPIDPIFPVSEGDDTRPRVEGDSQAGEG